MVRQSPRRTETSPSTSPQRVRSNESDQSPSRRLPEPPSETESSVVGSPRRRLPLLPPGEPAFVPRTSPKRVHVDEEKENSPSRTVSTSSLEAASSDSPKRAKANSGSSLRIPAPPPVEKTKLVLPPELTPEKDSTAKWLESMVQRKLPTSYLPRETVERFKSIRADAFSEDHETLQGIKDAIIELGREIEPLFKAKPTDEAKQKLARLESLMDDYVLAKEQEIQETFSPQKNRGAAAIEEELGAMAVVRDPQDPLESGFTLNHQLMMKLRNAKHSGPVGHRFDKASTPDTTFFPHVANPEFAASIDRDQHAGPNTYKMFEVSKKADKTVYFGTVHLEPIEQQGMFVAKGRDGDSMKYITKAKGEAFAVNSEGKWFKIHHDHTGKIVLEPVEKNGLPVPPWRMDLEKY